jgi:7-cyano-7-deazaguanine synthase in queuosine biosynthesis
VVWSGGLDSTAILLDYARDKKPLVTVYFRLENNEHKTNFEESRRNVIKSLLKEQNYEFKDRTIYIPAIRGGSSILYRNPQPSLWASHLVMGLQEQDSFEKILFVYVRCDDFWHYKESVIKVFNGMWELCVSGLDKDVPKLSFPLEWLSKEDLIETRYLIDPLGREVFDHVWTCEDPSKEKNTGMYTECEKCHACEVFKPLRVMFDREKQNRISKALQPDLLMQGDVCKKDTTSELSVEAGEATVLYTT